MLKPTKRIDSSRNPAIRAAVKLKTRRGRDKAERFLIEGVREVARALEAGVRLETLYTCSDLLRGDAEATLERVRGQNLSVTELSEGAFRLLSYRENPDGLIAVAHKLGARLAELALPQDALVLVVEGLEKPGNLGALLRTADSVAAAAVLVTGGGTDLENPNVIRSSMGSLFSRPVIAADHHALLEWLRREGFTVVATTPHTETLYWDARYTARTAIVLGTEHTGLTRDWLEAADERVKIPMSGLADSLNVATAGALLLYEALRQRRRS